jgi:hypothetical protein
VIDLAAMIATKTVETLVTELTKAAVSRAAKGFRDRQPYTTLDFKPHLEATFDRCTKIKTIVNGDSPIDLLHYYVPLDFSKSRTVVDDFAIIDTIIRDKSVVVSGAAGSGKSMFMRYLWVSYFVDSKGRIPLCIELRNLNSLEQSDILTFIYHNTVYRSSELGDRGRSVFDTAVEEGNLYLYLTDLMS